MSRDGSLKATVAQASTAVGTGTPFKDLKPAGQWNRLRATVKGGTLQAVTISVQLRGLHQFTQLGGLERSLFPPLGHSLFKEKPAMDVDDDLTGALQVDVE